MCGFTLSGFVRLACGNYIGCVYGCAGRMEIVCDGRMEMICGSSVEIICGGIYINGSCIMWWYMW